MVRCLKRYVVKRRTCREKKDPLPLLRQRNILIPEAKSQQAKNHLEMKQELKRYIIVECIHRNNLSLIAILSTELTKPQKNAAKTIPEGDDTFET